MLGSQTRMVALQEAGRARLSYLSFSCSRRCTKSTGSLVRSGSVMRARPTRFRCSPSTLRIRSSPPSTRLIRQHATSHCLTPHGPLELPYLILARSGTKSSAFMTCSIPSYHTGSKVCNMQRFPIAPLLWNSMNVLQQLATF